MKTLSLNQMEMIEGGSKLTQVCFFMPGIAIASYFSNAFAVALSNNMLRTCWDN